MTPLLDLADRHPLTTGAAGAFSGLFAFLMRILDLTADVAGKLAVIIFFLNAILALWIQMRRLRTNKAQRQQHLEQDVDFIDEDRL